MAIEGILKHKDITLLNLHHFIISNGLAVPNSGLYIGITDDPDRRVQEHGIDINTDYWVCYKCSSAKIAREIEAELLEQYQALGDKGGGNEKSVFVYVCRNPKR